MVVGLDLQALGHDTMYCTVEGTWNEQHIKGRTYPLV